MLRTLILTSLFVIGLVALPSASAEDGVCLEPLPDEIEPCLNTDTEICSAIAGCDPDDPTALLKWLRDQLGPCTCDPVD